MNPLSLARIVIEHCIEVDNPISNLQLQKILYFLQLKSIRVDGFEKRLIMRQVFEAWRFGPVISSVYNAYCRNGGLKITVPKSSPEEDIIIPYYVNDFIDNALKVKPFKLVALSHNNKGAWKQTYVEGKKYIISDQLICDEAKIIEEIDSQIECYLFSKPTI